MKLTITDAAGKSLLTLKDIVPVTPADHLLLKFWKQAERKFDNSEAMSAYVFDRMTASGYRKDLLTGAYSKRKR